MLPVVAVFLAATLFPLPGDVGGGGAPSLVVDLLDLQWWQALGIFLAGLGLSPAPWILGLAVNRIQFTKVSDAAHARELAKAQTAWDAEKANLIAYHDDLMKGKDQRYADLEAANQKNIDAAEQQRLRADKMTEALAESTKAIEGTNYVLHEFVTAAKEVNGDGPGPG